MHGDVVAFESDRYSEFLLFEQRGKVLFANKKEKKKRSEKKVGQFFFLSFFFGEKRNALSTMETMPVRLL